MLSNLLEKVFYYISPLQVYVVTGNSMEPTYHSGDRVVAIHKLLFGKRLKINDIVILRQPGGGKYIVKRIQKIKKGNVFVVGDSREESTDSRNFGWISRKEILYKVLR